MFGLFLFCTACFAFGTLYIVYANREPPRAIDHLFRIPAIFIFFPEHNRVRLGRLTMGVLLLGMGAVTMLEEIYHFVMRLV